MEVFSRTDMSLFGRWWWTVDRWTIGAVLGLMLAGVILILAGSPAVAEKNNYDSFHFVNRQFLFLPFALATMCVVSFLNERNIRRLAISLLFVSIVLVLFTLIVGDEVKGARRWISFFGFKIQPSEFIKPTFIVVSAWLFSMWRLNSNFPGHIVCSLIYCLVIGLLAMQPDFGMSVLISLVWGLQFFLAGLSITLVMTIGALFIFGGFIAYLKFGHVRDRIDQFVDPGNNEGFQVERSLEAFYNGGIFGRGPGEGYIKEKIPDAHSDFIFAVAAEEFGMFACLIIIALFAFIVLRGFTRVLKNKDSFSQLAVVGLLSHFGLQAIINLASTVNLVPTKGMTLPFISYGGSSLISVSLAMGIILALTRDTPGATGKRWSGKIRI